MALDGVRALWELVVTWATEAAGQPLAHSVAHVRQLDERERKACVSAQLSEWSREQLRPGRGRVYREASRRDLPEAERDRTSRGGTGQGGSIQQTTGALAACLERRRQRFPSPRRGPSCRLPKSPRAALDVMPRTATKRRRG